MQCALRMIHCVGDDTAGSGAFPSMRSASSAFPDRTLICLVKLR